MTSSISTSLIGKQRIEPTGFPRVGQSSLGPLFLNRLQEGIRATGLSFYQTFAPLLERRVVVQFATIQRRNLSLAQLKVFNINPVEFLRVNEALRDDREIVLHAVIKDGLALEYASQRLRDDPNIVLPAVTQNGLSLQYASPRLLADDEIVLQAVRKDGLALEYARQRPRDNPTIVLAAAKQNGSSFAFASDRLRRDAATVLAAFDLYNRILNFVNIKKLKDHNPIFLNGVRSRASLLRFVRDSLRDDPEIALLAVKQDGSFLEHVSRRLRDDYHIVLAAVTQNGSFLEYASLRLRDDLDIVSAALKGNSSAFRFASHRIKNDRDIAVRLIEVNHNVYSVLSSTISEDPSFIIKAAEKNGLVLQLIRPHLITLEICLAALIQNPKARDFVSQALLQQASATPDDPDFFPLLCKEKITLDRVCMALERNIEFFKFVSAEMQALLTPDIFISAVRENPMLLMQIADSLLEEEVVNTVIQMKIEPEDSNLTASRERALRHLSDQVLAGNFEGSIVNRWIYPLARYFSDNKRFILCAITYGIELSLASDSLKDDEEVVLAAISRDSFQWDHASDRLKANPTQELIKVLQLSGIDSFPGV